MAAAVAAATLVVTLTGGPEAVAEEPVTQQDSTSEVVTLITGDRVIVHRTGDDVSTEVLPALDREDVPFSTHGSGGEAYVVPADAQALLADGSLDLRLFEVAGLVEQGYGDADRDDIPLIVETTDQNATASVFDGDATMLSDLGVATTKQPKADTAQFWSAVTGAGTLSSGVDKIWLDGKRELSLDASVPQMGAPEAWDAGYTGDGVTVAVLDGGIDAEHPDFADNLVDAVDFTGGDDPTDTYGHGTHVASIIAGSGAASEGAYQGVAPDADLLIGKVCPGQSCDESAILAGMEWAAESGASVVNLSLGGTDAPEIDPLEQAVNDLTEQYGTLFVIAAGNSGGTVSVESPGSADAALTVGAVDKSDELADFSSRGPRIGDYAVKPDITAPGVDIVAARAAGTDMGEPVGDDYTAASGTSMATPHVAGAVAILAQQHPDWTPAQLKAALMASAEPNADLAAHEQGAGRVDVARAIGQELTADPVSVSGGMIEWPQEPGEPGTETVTYSNPTDEPVTLDLELVGHGPDGTAPEGMFTLDSDTVEVPAGGEASADITMDASGAGEDYGHYGGHITATAGDQSVVTPFAVSTEPESYNLTLEIIDRDGNPATSGAIAVHSLGPEFVGWFVYFSDGAYEIRLPVDEYQLSVSFLTGDLDDDYNTSVIIDPEVALDQDVAMTIDARDAEPVAVTVDDSDLTSMSFQVEIHRWLPGGGNSSNGLAAARPDRMFTQLLGEPLSEEEMFILVGATFTDRPLGEPASKVYQVFLRDQYTTGFEQSLEVGEFATVEAHYRSQAPSQQGFRTWRVILGGPGSWLPFGGARVETPSQGTEYVHADGLEIVPGFSQVIDGGDNLGYEYGPMTEYVPGETYVEEWGVAVFGPVFRTDRTSLIREPDYLQFAVMPFSGAGDGHFTELPFGSDVVASLYENGDLLGETGVPGGWSVVFTDLIPEEAEYRLMVDASRDDSPFSNEVTAEWAFTSSPADEAVSVPVVRFAPEGLDDFNAVLAGEAVSVPVSVQDSLAATVIDPAELSVEVSFDGGASWEVSPVEDGALSVTAPEGSEYVSLRAEAVDDAGHSVSLTIINAYAVN